MNCQKQVSHLLSFCLYREDDMQNEIMGFLSRHNGGKTAEIAEALAVTDYQARYYLLLLEKEGMVQRSPLRRGMATYWFLKGEMQAGQNCSSTT
ncbi:S/F1C fimbrial major subunit operon transcriptional regulator [Escherichia coli]